MIKTGIQTLKQKKKQVVYALKVRKNCRVLTRQLQELNISIRILERIGAFWKKQYKTRFLQK
jgi:hypothetical protein